MITPARIEALKDLGRLSWITCLRGPGYRDGSKQTEWAARIAVTTVAAFSRRRCRE